MLWALLSLSIFIFSQGKIGVMGVTESLKNGDPQSFEYHVHALRNDLYSDACFLKVIGKSVQLKCANWLH